MGVYGLTTATTCGMSRRGRAARSIVRLTAGSLTVPVEVCQTIVSWSPPCVGELAAEQVLGALGLGAGKLEVGRVVTPGGAGDHGRADRDRRSMRSRPNGDVRCTSERDPADVLLRDGSFYGRGRPPPPGVPAAKATASARLWLSSSAAITTWTCSSNSTPSSSAPRWSSSRPTAAAKLGCLSFFLTDFGVIPVQPVGANVRAGEDEARQLVDGIQRLLHRRLARNSHEIGVRGDRADQLGRVSALPRARGSRTGDGRPRGWDSARSRGREEARSRPTARRRRQTAGHRPSSRPRRPARGAAASPRKPIQQGGSRRLGAKQNQACELP